MSQENPIPRRRVGDHVEVEPHISDKSADTAKQLRRTLRVLVGATVLLYLVLAGFILVTRIDSNRSAKALCALRQDAKHRLVEGRRFLREHPHGFSGVSRTDIQRSIDGYQITVNALSVIDCDRSAVKPTKGIIWLKELKR